MLIDPSPLLTCKLFFDFEPLFPPPNLFYKNILLGGIAVSGLLLLEIYPFYAPAIPAMTP